MNESIQLLPSMSPRVEVKNNFKRKGPTFLALRQSLKRRSSTFFTKPSKPIKEDAIVIESSSESENSHNASNLLNPFKSAKHKEPNKMKYVEQWLNNIELETEDPLPFELSTILGDSDCIPKERGDVVNSTFDMDKCKKMNEFFASKKQVVQRLHNSGIISDSDKSDGKSLPDVKSDINDDSNVANSDKKPIDKFVNSVDINQSKSLSDNDIINISSSLEDISKSLRNINLNTPTRWDISSRFKYVTMRKNISRSGVSTNKENVSPEKSNTCSTIPRKAPPVAKTEPRPTKPKGIHSEKKSKTSLLYKNPYLESEIVKSNSLRMDLFKMRTNLLQESSFIKRIKQLGDSESDYQSANSDSESDKDDMFSAKEYSDREKATKPVQDQNLNMSAIESVLDEAYGDIWRKDRDRILPRTEPKPRRKLYKLSEEPGTSSERRRKLSPKKRLFESPVAQPLSTFELENPKEADELEDFGIFKTGIQESDKSESLSDQNLDIPTIESVLDEAYGDIWRKDRDRILPKTEPKPRCDLKLPSEPVTTSKRRSKTSPKQAYLNTSRTSFYEKVKKNLFESPIPKHFKPFESEPYYGLWDFETPKQEYTFLESLSGSVPIEECHPSAIKFRNNFKTHQDELRQILHDLYNENIFDNKLSGIKYVWSNRYLNTAGTCKRFNTTLGINVKITLAEKVIDLPDRLRDTLIHEMCHAAVFLIDKAGGGHGPHWKRWTAKAMTIFKELPRITVCHDYKLNHKYNYKCTRCGRSVGRHSKSIDIEAQGCRRCGGLYELFINKKCKNGDIKTVPVTPTPKKPINKFALFVKENYAIYRTPGVSHAEAMQELGNKYKETKEDRKDE